MIETLLTPYLVLVFTFSWAYLLWAWGKLIFSDWRKKL
jgi:hypothetical protein